MLCFFFFKQKTAYEMRISDWSSDVCSSDLLVAFGERRRQRPDALRIILAVLGIGVDLAFARQLEARGLGKGDDRAFLHIARLFFLRAVVAFVEAVLDDAERAAGFEHRENLFERVRGVVSAVETTVVEVGEGQHDIGATVGRSEERRVGKGCVGTGSYRGSASN